MIYNENEYQPPAMRQPVNRWEQFLQSRNMGFDTQPTGDLQTQYQSWGQPPAAPANRWQQYLQSQGMPLDTQPNQQLQESYQSWGQPPAQPADPWAGIFQSGSAPGDSQYQSIDALYKQAIKNKFQAEMTSDDGGMTLPAWAEGIYTPGGGSGEDYRDEQVNVEEATKRGLINPQQVVRDWIASLNTRGGPIKQGYGQRVNDPRYGDSIAVDPRNYDAMDGFDPASLIMPAIMAYVGLQVPGFGPLSGIKELLGGGGPTAATAAIDTPWGVNETVGLGDVNLNPEELLQEAQGIASEFQTPGPFESQGMPTSVYDPSSLGTALNTTEPYQPAPSTTTPVTTPATTTNPLDVIKNINSTIAPITGLASGAALLSQLGGGSDDTTYTNEDGSTTDPYNDYTSEDNDFPGGSDDVTYTNEDGSKFDPTKDYKDPGWKGDASDDTVYTNEDGTKFDPRKGFRDNDKNGIDDRDDVNDNTRRGSDHDQDDKPGGDKNNDGRQDPNSYKFPWANVAGGILDLLNRRSTSNDNRGMMQDLIDAAERAREPREPFWGLAKDAATKGIGDTPFGANITDATLRQLASRGYNYSGNSPHEVAKGLTGGTNAYLNALHPYTQANVGNLEGLMSSLAPGMMAGDKNSSLGYILEQILKGEQPSQASKMQGAKPNEDFGSVFSKFINGL